MKDNNLLLRYSYFKNLSLQDFALLSERSKEILSVVDAQMMDLGSEDGQNVVTLELDKQSKLSQISFKYSTNYQMALVLAVIQKLLLHKSIEEISQFSFREFENFLRDQNDVTAFSGHLNEEFTKVFNEMKLFFIAEVYKLSLRSHLGLSQELREMDHDFSLVTLNRYGLAILKQLKLQLVYANEQEIVITGSKIGLSRIELETILYNVFKVFPKLQDLKVVAV